jgi:Fe-Mn family superoxide dismutase
LRLHHAKHHATYVNEANAAASELDTVDPDDKPSVAGLRSALTFNLGGHVMHSLFWESLTATPGQPNGALADRISSDFGSTERFVELMTGACVAVQGSGWGVLSADPLTGRLEVGSIHVHQDQHVAGATALAVIDVWEHAYYLKYRNERAKWVESAVRHLNWDGVAARYDAARAMVSIA